MKKLLLVSLSILSAFSALSAKELKFSVGENAVANGGVYEFSGYTVYSYTSTQDEVFIDPEVYLVSDVTGDVSIKTTANYPVQVCIGGQCTADEIIEKNNLPFSANKKENLLLDCSVYVNKGDEIVLPAIEVLVEAWYSNDPATVYSFTLKMGDVNAGVNDIVKDKNAVKVVGKTLSYNLNAASLVSLYNLAGSAVGSFKVNGSGSLNLESLPAGIYLYRIEGAARETGKFIIR